MNRIFIPTTEQTPAASLPLLDAVKKQLGVVPNLMKLVDLRLFSPTMKMRHCQFMWSIRKVEKRRQRYAPLSISQ